MSRLRRVSGLWLVALFAIACGQAPPPSEPPAKSQVEDAPVAQLSSSATQTEAVFSYPLHLEGGIDVPGGSLGFWARVETDGEGRLEARLGIPAQGVDGAPLRVEQKANGALELVFDMVGATWTISPGHGEGDGLSCSFEQKGFKAPCTARSVSAAEAASEGPKAARPQTPTPPYPYDIEDVTYRNPMGDVMLAGTLTIPKAKERVPAALLISGSGAQDRDQTIAGHKPFWVLADHLSRRGIAVLRVDDRGVGGSSAGKAGPTSRDFATDVEAGLAFLRTHPRVAPGQLGLIGHSEGGLIAPMVAAKQGQRVAFVVLLAAPGVPGAELLVEQVGATLSASKASEGAVAQAKEQQRKVMRILAEVDDDEEATRQLRALLDPEGTRQAQVAPQIQMALTPWFRFFASYDPLPALRKVRAPVLVIAGGKDVQVVAEQNVAPIESALKKGRARSVTVEVFDDLNHLLQHAETGSVAEYATIEETIAPEVLELVATWIARVTGPTSRPARSPGRRATKRRD